MENEFNARSQLEGIGSAKDRGMEKFRSPVPCAVAARRHQAKACRRVGREKPASRPLAMRPYTVVWIVTSVREQQEQGLLHKRGHLDRWHGKASTEETQRQKKGCRSALGSLGKQWDARPMAFIQGGGVKPGPAQPEDQAPSCAAQDLSSQPASSSSGATPHRAPAQRQACLQHSPTGDQHCQGDNGDIFQSQP